ncbi:MAG: aminotransferase class V-fold PLP-dependent enzyme, partial [Clostridiales bacterium]|nr:aminotransferase class V-fold PLP-dependent enzyme [Clostridiales bacterium]
SVSGHKLGAPKGVGALYIRPGLSAVPLLFGGGQEGGLRAGTEPMPQIAGLAAASALRKARLAEDAARMAAVKAETLALLRARVPGLVVISEGDAPHICAVSLPGYPGEMLVRALSDEGVYVSSGSACHKGKPSHVYAALDMAKDVRMGAFRVSFSPENSAEDALALCRALEKVRRERFGAMR